MNPPEQAAGAPPGCPAHRLDELPRFPLARECPMHPPSGYLAAGGHPLRQVRQWNGEPAWLVTRYEDVRTLLRDPRVSADASAPGYPGQNPAATFIRKNYQNFAQMDPPRHTADRRRLIGEFTVRQVETLRPRIQSYVDGLIDRMLAQGSADFIADFAAPLPLQTICALLGAPFEHYRMFQSWARIVTSNATPPEEATRRIREFCDGYLADLVRAKDAAPQDDLLSRLVVNHMRTGDLSLHEVVSIARVLLMAGHESTGSTLGLGMLALLQHPDQMRRLQAEPGLVKSAVEEILRYVDVTHFGRRRTATADIAFGGVTIRAGEAMILLNHAANRDPATFADPDRFDIARNPASHLAFGFGIHQCLGQPLARLELQVAFGTLLRRLPGMRLAIAAEDIAFESDTSIYGLVSLPVAW